MLVGECEEETADKIRRQANVEARGTRLGGGQKKVEARGCKTLGDRPTTSARWLQW